MRNKQAIRVGWKGISSAVVLLLVLIGYQQWSATSASGAGLSAGMDTGLDTAADVTQVWNNVRNSSQYDFSADIEIKTIPLPTASNIGRFSKTDSLYLEGTNNLDERSITEATGYSMKVPMKASTKTTIRIGTAIGNSTRRKACQWVAPSTLAFSSMSVGMVSK